MTLSETTFAAFVVTPGPMLFDNEAEAHLFARLEAEFGTWSRVFCLEDPHGLVEIAMYGWGE
jgi:hypothetical protein